MKAESVTSWRAWQRWLLAASPSRNSSTTAARRSGELDVFLSCGGSVWRGLVGVLAGWSGDATVHCRLRWEGNVAARPPRRVGRNTPGHPRAGETRLMST
jgi:hypothetical protein